MPPSLYRLLYVSAAEPSPGGGASINRDGRRADTHGKDAAGVGVRGGLSRAEYVVDTSGYVGVRRSSSGYFGVRRGIAGGRVSLRQPAVLATLRRRKPKQTQ